MADDKLWGMWENGWGRWSGTEALIEFAEAAGLNWVVRG